MRTKILIATLFIGAIWLISAISGCSSSGTQNTNITPTSASSSSGGSASSQSAGSQAKSVAVQMPGLAELDDASPLRNAQVNVFDVSASGGVSSPAIATGQTDENGNFNITLPNGMPQIMRVVVTGTDGTVLSAQRPAYPTDITPPLEVSPLTTLVVLLVDEQPQLSLDDATTEIRQALSIPDDFDIYDSVEDTYQSPVAPSVLLQQAQAGGGLQSLLNNLLNNAKTAARGGAHGRTALALVSGAVKLTGNAVLGAVGDQLLSNAVDAFLPTLLDAIGLGFLNPADPVAVDLSGIQGTLNTIMDKLDTLQENVTFISNTVMQIAYQQQKINFDTVTRQLTTQTQQIENLYGQMKSIVNGGPSAQNNGTSAQIGTQRASAATNANTLETTMFSMHNTLIGGSGVFQSFIQSANMGTFVDQSRFDPLALIFVSAQNTQAQGLVAAMNFRTALFPPDFDHAALDEVQVNNHVRIQMNEVLKTLELPFQINGTTVNAIPEDVARRLDRGIFAQQVSANTTASLTANSSKTIGVDSTAGMDVGMSLTLDSGTLQETVQIASIGSSSIGLVNAVTKGHLSGVLVRAPGKSLFATNNLVMEKDVPLIWRRKPQQIDSTVSVSGTPPTATVNFPNLGLAYDGAPTMNIPTQTQLANLLSLAIAAGGSSNGRAGLNKLGFDVPLTNDSIGKAQSAPDYITQTTGKTQITQCLGSSQCSSCFIALRAALYIMINPNTAQARNTTTFYDYPTASTPCANYEAFFPSRYTLPVYTPLPASGLTITATGLGSGSDAPTAGTGKTFQFRAVVTGATRSFVTTRKTSSFPYFTFVTVTQTPTFDVTNIVVWSVTGPNAVDPETTNDFSFYNKRVAMDNGRLTVFGLPGDSSVSSLTVPYTISARLGSQTASFQIRVDPSKYKRDPTTDKLVYLNLSQDATVTNVSLANSVQVHCLATGTFTPVTGNFVGARYPLSLTQNTNLVWSVTGPAGVTVGQDGTVNIPAGTATGTVTVTATWNGGPLSNESDASKSNKAEVTITLR